MKSIDQIICREINPFDRESLVPGNFWQEAQDAALAVNSIHEEEIKQIKLGLNLVEKDNFSRTILLTGDSGSGKSYLLGRLKRNLNERAFFAYIGPWPDSNYIWRHTLRQTVDSLVCKPEGKKESQLLLWLKSLWPLKSQGFAKKIFGERRLFINNLRAAYPSKIYNPSEFFGVLYALTNPNLYYLACDWLRGDDLSEEDLRALKVRKSIDTEEVAQGILGNIGRISADNRPIVLCFDQLDSIPRLANESLDFQPLFNINSKIHNQKYTFRNYLIIISVITSTWSRNKKNIQPADLARGRINGVIRLKLINMQQAEALWQMRLHYIHEQADRRDYSKLYPLYPEQLKINFPGGRTNPRDVLIVGHKLYQTAKHGICKISTLDRNQKIKPEIDYSLPIDGNRGDDKETDLVVKFKLIWQKEYKKAQQKVTKITTIDGPQLIKMLQEILAAFETNQIQPNLLTGTYNLYSFSCLHPKTKENIGIVWTEKGSMKAFFYAMSASQNVVDKKQCQKLYLIRRNSVGNSTLKGNQIYRKIFCNSPHSHIKPDISSVIFLATYYELFKAAQAKELIVSQETISIKKLQDLVKESGVLNKCSLLIDLEIIDKNKESLAPDPKIDRKEIRDYLFSLVKTNQILGKKTLLEKTTGNFPNVKQAQIEESIQDLYRNKKIKFLNSGNNSQAQLICLLPQKTTA
ncbi:MAG: ATP-binding protein [Prochloraceae cyanobacterium]|nr:ATP-binding protein [Prochloraceae cyanobacterium]